MVSPWWKCSRWFCSRYGEVDVGLQHVAHLEVGVVVARLVHRDLAAGVLDLGHDFLEHRDLDGAGHLVDFDFGADVGAVLLGQGREDAVANQVAQLVAVQLLQLGQLLERREDFGAARHVS